MAQNALCKLIKINHFWRPKVSIIQNQMFTSLPRLLFLYWFELPKSGDNSENCALRFIRLGDKNPALFFVSSEMKSLPDFNKPHWISGPQIKSCSLHLMLVSKDKKLCSSWRHVRRLASLSCRSAAWIWIKTQSPHSFNISGNTLQKAGTVSARGWIRMRL